MGMATTKKSKKTTGKSRKRVSGKVRNRGPIESFKEKVHDVVNRKPEEETIPQVDEGNIIELKETKDADGKIIYQAPDVNVPPLSEGDKNLDDPVKDQIFNTEPEDAGLVLVGEQSIIEVPEAITTMVSTKEPPAELSGDGLVQPGKDDLTNPDPDPNDPPKTTVWSMVSRTLRLQRVVMKVPLDGSVGQKTGANRRLSTTLMARRHTMPARVGTPGRARQKLHPGKRRSIRRSSNGRSN